MKKALVTGSCGLIGYESVKFLINRGYVVFGVDNNMRSHFFGKEASNHTNLANLEKNFKGYYKHFDVDIRHNKQISKLFSKNKDFDLIIHTAAQPSHDWAAKYPFTDFSVNAKGTLVLLENFRKYTPKATFIFTSTNKVYGDTPNELPFVELDKRYELDKKHRFYMKGIDESMSIDQSKHSLFGVSKVAADVMVQEYGKYFNLHTGVFRGGCITGPAQTGAKLHGFLSYLVKSIRNGDEYTIFGYKGKQVRDNIHSYDLVNMFWHYHQKPKKGEVYNAGGSRYSNVSMLEAIEKIEKILGVKANIKYSSKNRSGDHIWYISDVSKFKKHYPSWGYSYSVDKILKELCET